MMTDPYDTATHDELNLMQGYPPPPDKRVTRLNGVWEPPYNRWAYQHMREIWPTAPIRPAGTAVELPRAIDPAIDQLKVRRRDGSMAAFQTYLRQSFADSLTVISGGQIVYESYLNGMTADTPHIMFSCTKSFIGLFALMAIEEGQVTEDTAITDILPELANSAFAEARFGHVLDMTTAIRFSEDYADPAAEIHDYVGVLGSGAKAGDPTLPLSLYDYASSLKPLDSRAHGAVFEYQTPEADVLNWAVNRVLGESFVDSLETRLWSKLGMTGQDYVMLDPSGILFSGGGLCATASDMARFAAMMLNGGRAQGQQVVSPRCLETLARGGSTEAFLAGPSGEDDMGDGHWSYRAQWWVRNTPGHEAFMALGVNGQWIYIDPTRDVAIVQQSSQPEADDWYFFTYTLNAIDTLIAHLSATG